MLLLKILGGVLALLLGIKLGMPARYERRSDAELDRLLEHGRGTGYKAKKRYTFIDWLHNEVRGSHRRTGRSPFKTAAPKRRED